MRTDDGGATFKRFNAPGAQDLDFRDIYAWDARTAVAMSAGPGEKSRTYRTEDGGASWNLTHQNADPKGFFDGIAFWDRSHGILVGDPVGGSFTVLLTADGGRSWKPAPSAPAANEGEGAFAASGTSVAVAKGGKAWIGTGGKLGARVFYSNDWGKSWTAVQTPVTHATATAGIFSLWFDRDGKSGFAIGGDYQKPAETAGVLALTRDGGVHWVAVPGVGGYRSSVVSAGGNIILAAGPDGCDISRNGGDEWRPLSKDGFHTLSIGKDGAVWASGSGGRVAKLNVRVKN